MENPKFRQACSSHFRGFEIDEILFLGLSVFLCHHSASTLCKISRHYFRVGGGGDEMQTDFSESFILFIQAI